MATGGLYGQSSAGIVSPQSGSESSGLYGNNTVFGGTYFEWFIFQVADTQPATPTGGSWSFTTNSGTPPSGWLGSPPANPTNTVWVSVGLVNSKSSSAIEWSSPGKFSFASGLPILSGASEPASGDGQSDQLYIQTNTTPETIWFKQAGTWTRLTGPSLYVDLTSNQTIAGTKTFSSEIQGSISGNAANVTGIVDITHGGTGSTTASAARTALGAAASGANADITSMSGVTGGITTPDYITFDVNPSTVPTAPGSLYWDSADGNQTLSLVMAGGNATQQIGEEQYYRIKASAAITEGQVVMFTGTVGASGALTGAPATGLTASTASYVMGVATQNIALNDWGYVTSFGLVRNINTNAWAAGTILYYDPTVAGGLTSTLPSAPNAKVQVCAVIYQSASNGSLFVRPSFGGILGQYEGDVGFISTTAGDVIVRNSGNTAWENKAQSTLIAGNVSGTVAIANGGTGQTTANAAFNALVPSQTGNNGKYLTTDGSNTSWATNPLGTVTSVNASGGTTGLTFSGGPITTSGTLTLAGTLGTANGGTNLTSFTANGVMYASSTSVLTTGSALQFDGANLGLGVTPSAWSLFTGLQVGPSGSISNNGTGTPVTVVSNNAYYNGTSWVYVNTAAASQYQLSTSQHIWRYTASGSGNITWSEAMRIDSSGNLGVGTSSPTNLLTVGSSSVRGTIQVNGTNGASPYVALDNTATASGRKYSIYSGGAGAGEFNIYDATAAAIRVTLDSSGNLGLGVTPSAWGSIFRAFQIGNSDPAFIAARTDGPSQIHAGVNAFYDGTNWKYINADYASRYYQSGGTHVWETAASGSAGSTVTFTQAMTLDANGNLGLNVVPNTWYLNTTVYKALQFGSSSLFFGNTTASSSNVTLYANAYLDTSAVSKYLYSSYASKYGQSSGVHTWSYAASGTAGGTVTWTDAMTLNASGNLLVGATSGAARLYLKQSDGTASSGVKVVRYNNDNQYLSLWATGGSRYIDSVGDSSVSSELVFRRSIDSGSNFTESARIDSSGNLLVGTTTGVGAKIKAVQSTSGYYAGLFENSNSSSPFGVDILYSGTAPNNTTNRFIDCEDTVGIKFQVRSNGGIANYSANNVNLSDSREKTNANFAGNYLAKICAIPVRTYNYIDQNLEEDDGLTLGVFAQDVQSVAPELVNESNWGTEENPKMRLSIYQTDLQYALMKALQELKAENDSLKARLDAANL